MAKVHIDISVSTRQLPNMQRSVSDNGKHTACGEQHESIMHTDISDVHV